MKSRKTPKTPSSVEKLLSEITRFGKKSGLKRVRVKVKDIEAEVEFHGGGTHSLSSTLSPPAHPSPSLSESSQSPPSTSGDLHHFENNSKYHVIKSPLVGTFYRAPSPNAKPFVESGDRVEKGTTLAIIEAMKLMNELECEHTGTVEKILVENDTPVEYDQPLFVLSI